MRPRTLDFARKALRQHPRALQALSVAHPAFEVQEKQTMSKALPPRQQHSEAGAMLLRVTRDGMPVNPPVSVHSSYLNSSALGTQQRHCLHTTAFMKGLR